MMKHINRLALFLFVLAAALPAWSQFRGNSYHECLLDATRQDAAHDERSIGRVKTLCRERFPASAPKHGSLRFSEEALAKIDLWTSRNSRDDIQVTVYNGNPGLILTELILLLTPVKSDDPVQDFFDSEEFAIPVDIEPNKTETYTISAEDTDITGRFRWSIVRAVGY